MKNQFRVPAKNSMTFTESLKVIGKIGIGALIFIAGLAAFAVGCIMFHTP